MLWQKGFPGTTLDTRGLQNECEYLAPREGVLIMINTCASYSPFNAARNLWSFLISQKLARLANFSVASRSRLIKGCDFLLILLVRAVVALFTMAIEGGDTEPAFDPLQEFLVRVVVGYGGDLEPSSVYPHIFPSGSNNPVIPSSLHKKANRRRQIHRKSHVQRHTFKLPGFTEEQFGAFRCTSDHLKVLFDGAQDPFFTLEMSRGLLADNATVGRLTRSKKRKEEDDCDDSYDTPAVRAAAKKVAPLVQFDSSVDGLAHGVRKMKINKPYFVTKEAFKRIQLYWGVENLIPNMILAKSKRAKPDGTGTQSSLLITLYIQSVGDFPYVSCVKFLVSF